MTLLVAGVDGNNIWMVADTTVTGGGVDVRDREYELKIVPSRDGRALLGFAGDLHFGSLFVEEVASMPAGQETLGFLLERHLQTLKGDSEYSVDFAYGYLDDTGPHLYRLSKGKAQELATLNIGEKDAFEHFQRIRHDATIASAPDALTNYLISIRRGTTQALPERLSSAVKDMLRLFAERSERDVGGWPTPYLLTREAVFLCGYCCLSIGSDPKPTCCRLDSACWDAGSRWLWALCHRNRSGTGDLCLLAAAAGRLGFPSFFARL